MAATITSCAPADIDHFAGLVTRAFTGNPITTWLATDMPDDAARQRLFQDYFRLFVDHAVHSGLAEATGDGLGVALWFSPDSGPPPHYDEHLAEITGRHLWRFRTLDDQMHHAHPGGSHHHLAFLAVEPDAHNRGHGTALLHHHHARLDALGAPAYLEASHPRNRALYARLGYTSHDASIRMPDGGPAMWPMIKLPETVR